MEAVSYTHLDVYKRQTICGGGAKSVLWRKIVANVMNMQVDTVEVEEGPAYGLSLIHIYTADSSKAADIK